MNQSGLFLVLAAVLFWVPGTNAWADQVTQDEALELPTIDLTRADASGNSKETGRSPDRFNFTEEASGDIDLLSEKEALARPVGKQGPRFLPSPLEKGIGQGIRGIEQITYPFTQSRELPGPGKDTVIEFDPASQKQFRMEF